VIQSFADLRTSYDCSAGGGGTTKHRKEKIKEKNHKLNEERAQRAQKEEATKSEKQKAEDDQARQQREDNAIHPSRRGMVQRR
jgi:nucleolar protein 6